jgi:hypothetical protein
LPENREAERKKDQAKKEGGRSMLKYYKKVLEIGP